MARPSRAALIRPAAVLLTGLAYFVATGVNQIWPLAWIAPVPILLLAVRESARVAMVSAFLAYLLGSASYLPAAVGVVPAAVLAFGLAVPAFAFGLAVLAQRAVMLRHDHWSAVFVLPALWTAWDHFWPYARLPYSQADFLSLVQIASVTGLSGITFLMMLVPAGIAVAWHTRRRWGTATAALGIPIALCLCVAIWGWARLARPVTGTPVRVGLAATDETVRYFRTERADEALPVVAAYARRAGILAERGAEVIVLPEKFVGVTAGYADEARATLAEVARAHGVRIVAGLNQLDPPAPRNQAVVFDPRGQIEMEYYKRLLVPGFEDAYRPGDRLGLLPTADGLWGVAICRDLLFPELGREYARAGVGLMLIPAWDFVSDRDLQVAATRLRAVEGGYAIARTAQEGVVLVVDDQGRVLAAAATPDEAEVLLVADVRPAAGRTVYSRIGDWFAWLSIAASVVLIALIAIDARRRT